MEPQQQPRSEEGGPLPWERRSLVERKQRSSVDSADSAGGDARALLASPISGRSSDNEFQNSRPGGEGEGGPGLSSSVGNSGGGRANARCCAGGGDAPAPPLDRSLSSTGERRSPREGMKRPSSLLPGKGGGGREPAHDHDDGDCLRPPQTASFTLFDDGVGSDCCDSEGEEDGLGSRRRLPNIFREGLVVGQAREAPMPAVAAGVDDAVNTTRREATASKTATLLEGQREDSEAAELDGRTHTQHPHQQRRQQQQAEETATVSASEKSLAEIRDDTSAEQSTQTADSHDARLALHGGGQEASGSLFQRTPKEERQVEKSQGEGEGRNGRPDEGESLDSAGASSAFLCCLTCDAFQKRRNRRLCLLGIAALFVFFVLVLPLLLCVVAPNLVKTAVANTQFKVERADVRRNGERRLDVDLSLFLSKPPPVASQVEALTASAWWNERHLGSLEIPSITLARGASALEMQTSLTIEDEDVWRDFAADFVKSGEAFWKVQGQATVSAIGLTFPDVPLVTRVPVRGPVLNVQGSQGPKPFRVVSLDMSESDASRIAFFAEVEFVNSSPTAVETLGEVAFELQYEGVSLGTIESQGELALARGVNRYAFKGEINPLNKLAAAAAGGAASRASSLRRDLRVPQKVSGEAGQASAVDHEAFLEALGFLVSRTLSGQSALVLARGVFCSDELFRPAVEAAAVTAPISQFSVMPRVPSVPAALDSLEGEALGKDSAETAPASSVSGVSGGLAAPSTGGVVRPEPSPSSALSSLLEGLRLRDVQVLDSVAGGGASSVDLRAKVEARIANPLGRNAPLRIENLTLQGLVYLDGERGPRVGVLKAHLTARGSPRLVSEDAPLLGEENQEEEKGSSLVAGENQEPQNYRVLEFDAEGDGGASAKKFVEESGFPGTSGRRLSEATINPLRETETETETETAGDCGGSSSSFNVANAAWMDAAFVLRGSLELADGGAGFAQLVHRMASDDKVALALVKSTADVLAGLGFGSLKLANVPLDHVLKLPGLGGARGALVSVTDLQVLKAEALPTPRWTFKTTAKVFCPLPVSLSLGAVGLRLSFQGKALGFLCTTGFALRQGLNELNFLGVLEPGVDLSPDEGRDLLSQLFSAAVSEAPLEERPVLSATLSFDSQAFAPLVPWLTSLAGETFDYGTPPEPPRAVKAAVEGLSVFVPVPSIGSAADFLESAELLELRVLQDSSSRAVDGSPSGEVLHGVVGVPLNADLRIVMKNPLGSRVPLSVQRVVVALRVASLLPAEASSVLTPSGERKNIAAVSPAVKVRRWIGRVETSVEAPVCAFAADASGGEGGFVSEEEFFRRTTSSLSTEGASAALGVSETATASFAFVEMLSPLATDLQLDGARGLEAFAGFAAAFVELDSIETQVEGRATCTLATCFGPVAVTNLPIKLRVALPGLGGANEIEVRALEIVGIGLVDAFAAEQGSGEDGETFTRAIDDGEGSTTRGLLLRLSASVRNKSSLRMNLGALVLELLYHGVRVGLLRSAPTQLVPGEVAFDLAGGFFLNALTEGPLSRLFSAALKRDAALQSDSLVVRVSDLELRDETGRIPTPLWLSAAMRRLELRSPLPSLADLLPGLDAASLVRSVAFNKVVLVASSAAADGRDDELQFLADVSLQVRSPWPAGSAFVPLRILGVEFQADLLAGEEETVIGRLGSVPWTRDEASEAFLQESGLDQPDPQSWFEEGEADAETGTSQGARLRLRLPVRAALKTSDGGAVLAVSVRRFLADPQAPLVFSTKGEASVRVELGGVAKLTLAEIPLHAVVPLGGFVAASGKGRLKKTSGEPGGGQGKSGSLFFAPQIRDLAFKGRHPSGEGLAFGAEASLVNPTPFSMELPSLRLRVSFRDVVLAELESKPALLRASPGETRIAVEGIVFQQTSPNGLEALSALVDEALATLVLGDEDADEEEGASNAGSDEERSSSGLLVRVLGVGVSDGLVDSEAATEHKAVAVPAWLAASLEGLEIEAPLDGSGLVPANALREVSLISTEIWVREPDAPIHLRARVALRLGAFFGEDAEFSVEDLAVRGLLREETSLGAPGALLGSLAPLSPTEAGAVPQARRASRSGDALAAQNSSAGDEAALQLEVGVALRVEDEEAFAAFAVKALREGSASCVVEGEAFGSVRSPLGLISLRRLRVRQRVNFGGVDALFSSLTQNVRVLNFALDSVALDGDDGLDRVAFTVDVKLGTGQQQQPSRDALGSGFSPSTALEFHTQALALSLLADNPEEAPEESLAVGVLLVSEASLGGEPHPLRVVGELFEDSAVKRLGKSRLASLMQSAVNGRPLGVRIAPFRTDAVDGSQVHAAARSSLVAEAAQTKMPEWLRRVVEGAELSPSISGLGSTLELLRGVSFGELSVDLSSSQAIALEGLVEARVFSPLGADVPLRVRRLSGEVSLVGEGCTDEGGAVSVASLSLSPRVPEKQIQTGDELTVQLRLSKTLDALRLHDEGSAFACFLSAVVNGRNPQASSLRFLAVVSASVETPLGAIEVQDLEIEGGSEVLDALSGGTLGDRRPSDALADLDFTIDDLKFAAPPAGARGLAFSAALQLRLPMDLSLSLGPLHMAILLPSRDAAAGAAVPFGSIRLPALEVRRGKAELEAQGLVDPHPRDLDEVSAFVSQVLAAATPSSSAFASSVRDPLATFPAIETEALAAPPRVVVRGVSVQLPDGSAPPQWVASFVKALQVEAALPAFDFLVGSFLDGVVVREMRLECAGNAQDEEDSVLLGAGVSLPLESPFGEDAPPLRVRRLGLKIDLFRLQEGGADAATASESPDAEPRGRRLATTGESLDVGTRVLPLTEALLRGAEFVGRLEVSERHTEPSAARTASVGELSGEELKVPPTPLRFGDEGAAFARLALSLLGSEGEAVGVGLVGEASAEVETPLGALKLERIPVRSRLALQRLALLEPTSLRRMAVSAMRSLTISDLPESLRFTSPSSRTPVPALALRTSVDVAALPAGMHVSLEAPLSFFILREGKQLGAVVIPRVSLTANADAGGAVRLSLRGVVWPEASASIEEVATAFLANAPMQVQVVGAPDACEAVLLSAEGMALRLATGAPSSTVIAAGRASSSARTPRWLRQVLAGLRFDTRVGGVDEEASPDGHAVADGGVMPTTASGAVNADPLLKAVELEGVDVDLTGERNPMLEAAFAVVYVLPPQFRVRHSIKGVEGSLEIFPVEEGDDPPALAAVSVQRIRVMSQEVEAEGRSREFQQTHRLFAEMGATEMQVYADGEEAFTRLMQRVMDSTESVQVRVKGAVKVFVETVVGSLGVPTEVDLWQSVDGLGGLSGNEFFRMSSMTVVGGDADYLDATAKVALQMPPWSKSVIGVDLGPSAFDLALPVPAHALPLIEELDPEFVEGYVVREGGRGSQQQGTTAADEGVFELRGQPVDGDLKDETQDDQNEKEVLDGRPIKESESTEGGEGRTLIVAGVVNVPHLRIYSPAKLRRLKLSGQPEQQATAVLFAPPKTRDGVDLKVGTRELMSRYVNGQTSHVVVLSNSMTSQNALLQGFLKDFRVEVDIAGSEKPFIHEVLISVKLRGLAPFVEAVTVFENPTDVSIKFLYADLETFFQGGSLGKMEIDLRSNPDIIYPNRINKSSPVVVKPQIKDGTFALLMKVLRHVAAGRGPKPSVEAKGIVVVSIQDFLVTLDIDISGIELSVPMAPLNVGSAAGPSGF